RHRTESYEYERKHFYSTTPTIEEAIEWQEYLRGDQRKYFVPCPHCGTLQHLEWGGAQTRHGVKWAKDAQRADKTWDFAAVKETVRYHCISEDCDGPGWT